MRLHALTPPRQPDAANPTVYEDGRRCVVPECPRCHYPAPEAPTTCTQCGSAVPAPGASATRLPLPKVFLLVLLAVLLAVLFLLALEYTDAVGRLAK